MQIRRVDAKGQALSRQLLCEDMKAYLQQHPITIIENDDFTVTTDIPYVNQDLPIPDSLKAHPVAWWHRDCVGSWDDLYALNAIILHSYNKRKARTVIAEEEKAIPALLEQLNKKNADFPWDGNKSFQAYREFLEAQPHELEWSHLFEGIGQARGPLSAFSKLKHSDQVYLLNTVDKMCSAICAYSEPLREVWSAVVEKSSAANIYFDEHTTLIFDNRQPYVHGRVSDLDKAERLHRFFLDFRETSK